jgi:tryptophan halogenase
VKNCVAVGLAGGFLEPLEPTGIILIEAASYMLAALCQRGDELEPAAQKFNAHMTRRYERIVDFIKMHYYLTRRTDSEFWRDNARPDSAPESLLAHLETWRHRPPSAADFALDHESFAPANYQYVLYGMGFRTARLPDPPAANAALARREFARVRAAAQRAATALPPHRELLERVYQAGFNFAGHAAPPVLPALMR